MNLILGDRFVSSAASRLLGVSDCIAKSGVAIWVAVLVATGKFKVIAGRGINVVVGVCVGVEEGV